MSVRINTEICNGCGRAQEPCCARVCPGDLLFRNTAGKAQIRDARDCWDCAACVKECPRQAIALYLPAQVGGRGSSLKARKEKDKIVWTLQRPDGSTETIEVLNEKII